MTDAERLSALREHLVTELRNMQQSEQAQVREITALVQQHNENMQRLGTVMREKEAALALLDGMGESEEAPPPEEPATTPSNGKTPSKGKGKGIHALPAMITAEAGVDGEQDGV